MLEDGVRLQASRRFVVVIPQLDLRKRRRIRTRVYGMDVGTDRAPAALGLYATQGGVTARQRRA